MANAKKVDEFIKEMFEVYSLDYAEFFDESDDDAALNSPSGSKENHYALNMPMVELAAKILGVDTTDILTLNSEAVMKWLKKYPYFWHRPAFDEAYRRSFHDESYKSLRLLEVIFEKEVVPDYPTRYDYSDVIHRLDALLRSIDKSVPGTYHAGASMENLSIYTKNFCHFEHIKEMVESYIEMFDRAKGLFFKAWDTDLSQDEIHEYNFLVATIGLQDNCYIREYLFYDLLKSFLPVYRSEGYKDFFSYVRIYHHRVLEAWKCAEFSQDKALVQKFTKIYPQAKKSMREFSLETSKFECFFTWSDAKPAISTQEDLDDINHTAAMLGEDPVTFDDCAKEPTLIYVSKTPEELGGDEIFAENLRILSGPETLGGVHVPKIECDLTPEQAIKRTQARVMAMINKKESNLHE